MRKVIWNGLFIKLEIENLRSNGSTENWIVFGDTHGKNQLQNWWLENKICWVQLEITQPLSKNVW